MSKQPHKPKKGRPGRPKGKPTCRVSFRLDEALWNEFHDIVTAKVPPITLTWMMEDMIRQRVRAEKGTTDAD